MKKLLIILAIPLATIIVNPAMGNSTIIDVNTHTDQTERDDVTVCPVLVQTAMDVTSAACDDTGRNQACYGHILLEAQVQPGAYAADFSMPGNRVDVTRLQTLRLAPMNVDEEVWGIALMQLQANLSTSQPENVTLLVFGDVQLENAVGTPTRAEVTVTTQSFVNVRRGPTTNAGVVGTLRPGQPVIALERLADGSWLRVELEDGITGWVLGELVSQPERDTLNTVESWRPYYRPMQAFYYRSGTGDTVCPQHQTDGMLIQTPEGVGRITLLINEVDIQIGSTVFFQAQPGGNMTITTLEGQARVNAYGVTQTAIAGTQVTVPLAETLSPAGPPTAPRPFDEFMVEGLPLMALPRLVQPQPALTQAEIEAFITVQSEASVTIDLQQVVGPEGNDNANQTDDDAGGPPDCPGESCNAPGLGGTCPGRSCDTPAQN